MRCIPTIHKYMLERGKQSKAAYLDIIGVEESEVERPLGRVHVLARVL